MKNDARGQHPVDSFASLLLFGLSTLFLMLLLLFSAEAYRSSVRGQEQNYNLYTAQAYLIHKFRQCDQAGATAITQLDGSCALRFSQELDGQTYHTWLYLRDGSLRELFTQEGSQADAKMGIPIASLSRFEASLTEAGFYHIVLEDEEGSQTDFLLHPGVPRSPSSRTAKEERPHA
ncbi:MAG: DUF4860 domain-containing protein [Eubacteriales bacterium]|nr:DUF4860 domain-containing protein [Eubacteriales bacterium]